MNHAVGYDTSRSRCSFMADTPLRLVNSMQMAHPHFRNGSGDFSITVPFLSEKYLQQSRQRYGIGLPLLTRYAPSVEPHSRQLISSSGQYHFSNQLTAACSVASISATAMTLMPLR